MKLWDGTIFAEVARNLWSVPLLRLAYLMGQVDAAIFETFGHEPDAENAPDEARECAALMMEARASSPEDMERLMARALAIHAAWKARREVH